MVGRRGFRGAVNDFVSWILRRSRKRAMRRPAGKIVLCAENTIFPETTLYPEDGFCAW
jgi:hypothetical protein